VENLANEGIRTKTSVRQFHSCCSFRPTSLGPLQVLFPRKVLLCCVPLLIGSPCSCRTDAQANRDLSCRPLSGFRAGSLRRLILGCRLSFSNHGLRLLAASPSFESPKFPRKQIGPSTSNGGVSKGGADRGFYLSAGDPRAHVVGPLPCSPSLLTLSADQEGDHTL